VKSETVISEAEGSLSSAPPPVSWRQSKARVQRRGRGGFLIRRRGEHEFGKIEPTVGAGLDHEPRLQDLNVFNMDEPRTKRRKLIGYPQPLEGKGLAAKQIL
jgi:hypothetical protein